MVDINRHKFLLMQILKDINTDIELLNTLGFEGGTALMFFYDLPRFSVDLDFNLLKKEKEDLVFAKVKKILGKYGNIHDAAKKYYGAILVLNYGHGERKLKVEISNRDFENRYEIKNLLGINMKVLKQEDMFSHKLCALLDRSSVTNRDIFDCWFFMDKRTPINKAIVESRMNMPLAEYLQRCIDLLESMHDHKLLHGLGDLMDENRKQYVRSAMRKDTISLLKFYKAYPILG